MNTHFYRMSSEELREYELDSRMESEIAEMYQMDEDDLFDRYGVESHSQAYDIITEYYCEIA